MSLRIRLQEWNFDSGPIQEVGIERMVLRFSKAKFLPNGSSATGRLPN